MTLDPAEDPSRRQVQIACGYRRRDLFIDTSPHAHYTQPMSESTTSRSPKNYRDTPNVASSPPAYERLSSDDLLSAPPASGTWTVSEAAHILGVAPTTVRSMIASGHLVAAREPHPASTRRTTGRWLIDHDSLARHLSSRKSERLRADGRKAIDAFNATSFEQPLADYPTRDGRSLNQSDWLMLNLYVGMHMSLADVAIRYGLSRERVRVRIRRIIYQLTGLTGEEPLP